MVGLEISPLTLTLNRVCPLTRKWMKSALTSPDVFPPSHVPEGEAFARAGDPNRSKAVVDTVCGVPKRMVCGVLILTAAAPPRSRSVPAWTRPPKLAESTNWEPTMLTEVPFTDTCPETNNPVWTDKLPLMSNPQAMMESPLICWLKTLTAWDRAERSTLAATAPGVIARPCTAAAKVSIRS